MAPLSSLLKHAFQRVNASGGAFAAGVGIGGVVLIVLQGLMLVQLGLGLLQQLKVMVGPQRAVQLEEQIAKDGIDAGDLEYVRGTLMQELDSVLAPLSESQRSEYLLSLGWDIVRHAGAPLLALVIGILVLQLFLRSYFLVLASRRMAGWGSVVLRSLTILPRLIAVWIGVALCGCLWLPIVVFAVGFVSPGVLMFAFISLFPTLLLLPRFYCAPVILLQEGTSVRRSLQLSYERTKGLWWDVFKKLVGCAVIVWIATTLTESILESLVQALLRYSPAGLGLYALGPLIGLIAIGYRTFFAVELKEEISRAGVRL